MRDAREQVFFSDLIVPHETAHQWWGSILTSEGADDEWLLEALANYSSLLWMEKKKGLREMDKVLDGYRGELLSKSADGAALEAAGPIVWGDRLAASPNPNTWRVITYDKGTWIMHILRRRIGDEAFLKILAELRRRYAAKTVTTADFRALVRELRPKSVSADAVDAFFDNWVYATGIPALKLKYTVKGAAPAWKVSGTIEQSGVDEDFAADVPVEIQSGKGSRADRLGAHGGEGNVVHRECARHAFTRGDRRGRVVEPVTQTAPFWCIMVSWGRKPRLCA